MQYVMDHWPIALAAVGVAVFLGTWLAMAWTDRVSRRGQDEEPDPEDVAALAVPVEVDATGQATITNAYVPGVGWTVMQPTTVPEGAAVRTLDSTPAPVLEDPVRELPAFAVAAQTAPSASPVATLPPLDEVTSAEADEATLPAFVVERSRLRAAPGPLPFALDADLREDLAEAPNEAEATDHGPQPCAAAPCDDPAAEPALPELAPTVDEVGPDAVPEVPAPAATPVAEPVNDLVSDASAGPVPFVEPAAVTAGMTRRQLREAARLAQGGGPSEAPDPDPGAVELETEPEAAPTVAITVPEGGFLTRRERREAERRAAAAAAPPPVPEPPASDASAWASRDHETAQATVDPASEGGPSLPAPAWPSVWSAPAAPAEPTDTPLWGTVATDDPEPTEVPWEPTEPAWAPTDTPLWGTTVTDNPEPGEQGAPTDLAWAPTQEPPTDDPDAGEAEQVDPAPEQVPGWRARRASRREATQWRKQEAAQRRAEEKAAEAAHKAQEKADADARRVAAREQKVAARAAAKDARRAAKRRSRDAHAQTEAAAPVSEPQASYPVGYGLTVDGLPLPPAPPVDEPSTALGADSVLELDVTALPMPAAPAPVEEIAVPVPLWEPVAPFDASSVQEVDVDALPFPLEAPAEKPPAELATAYPAPAGDPFAMQPEIDPEILTPQPEPEPESEPESVDVPVDVAPETEPVPTEPSRAEQRAAAKAAQRAARERRAAEKARAKQVADDQKAAEQWARVRAAEERKAAETARRAAQAAEKAAAKAQAREAKERARAARSQRGQQSEQALELAAAAEALRQAAMAAEGTPDLGQAGSTPVLAVEQVVLAPRGEDEDGASFVIGSSRRAHAATDHVAFDLPEPLPAPLPPAQP